jgi:hypothetical protein
MLYLREDVIVAQLATHPDLAGKGRNPHGLATYLRGTRSLGVSRVSWNFGDDPV